MLEDTYKHKGMRNALVDSLQKKGIRDERVLAAMRKVPRHFFMDSAFVEHAYQDKAFAIGEGQTISQPYTVAFQSSLLELEEGDKVLEIGTGSGYQASILLELDTELVTIEYNRKLHLKATKLLTKLGYRATFLYGDGSKGAPNFAPYDKIIVTAGAPSVPEALLAQLKIGGILVIPVGNLTSQHMLKIVKEGERKIRKIDCGNFAFVQLRGDYGWGQ
ncbi:protein-L-isoaspartate(D-aspartate) O-methyltransferase [Rapidithrix thailandica]|uniref:Protein-L-isoaspartate O-methyltransferase n=1 Tax=Rapidithrix thailandica TaxID=413964 RepID=A0AAW9RPG3_9BACT